MSSTTKVQPKLVDAVFEFGGFLPKSASVFVGLTGVAYFSGWTEEVAYYSALGAPWIVSSLPAFAFLLLSAGMVASIAVSAFISLHHIAVRKNGHKHVVWTSGALIIIASCLGLAPQIVPACWLSPYRIWLFADAHAQLMFLGAGGLLGEAISQFRCLKLKLSPATAFTIYLFVVYGLYSTPAQRGTARANFHIAQSSNALPVVQFIGGLTNERWQLVEVLGQNALLIKLASTSEGKVFRLVQTKDVTAIRQMHLPN